MTFTTMQEVLERDLKGEWDRAQTIQHSDIIIAFGEADRDWELAVQMLCRRFNTNSEYVWKMVKRHYVPTTGFYCLDKATVENVLAFGFDDWGPAMDALGISQEQLQELTDVYQIQTSVSTGRPGACTPVRVAIGPDD